MLKEKDKYTCPICKEFTSHDEWADGNSCINCGPVNTDSSKGIEKSVLQGEKGSFNTSFYNSQYLFFN